MLDWKNMLLMQESSIMDAINTIEKCSSRVAFIVNEDNKLLGVVTDGDIRRAIINNICLKESVKKIMSSNPKVGYLHQKHYELKALMQKEDLLQVPIVDEKGILVGLETFQSIVYNKKFDNSVFIMAGGFGKRLLPLTESTPKPMLTIGGKPILENIIRRFIKYGFYKFYISLHYCGEKITEYFGNGEKWGVEIQYVYEEEPLGTAGALGLLPNSVGEKPMIVINGDLLTKVNFANLLQFHLEQKNSVATICVRKYEFQVPYGVVKSNDFQVASIDEKPVHNFFVNAGVYVIEQSVRKQLKTYGYLDMPELLNGLSNSNKAISTFPIHEYWLDIGKMENYEKAQNDYSSGII